MRSRRTVFPVTESVWKGAATAQLDQRLSRWPKGEVGNIPGNRGKVGNGQDAGRSRLQRDQAQCNMCLKKVTGVAAVLVFFGRLVRPGFRDMRRGMVVHCHEMAFFVFYPVKRRCRAGARCENVGEKNRQQQKHQPRFDAQ